MGSLCTFKEKQESLPGKVTSWPFQGRLPPRTASPGTKALSVEVPGVQAQARASDERLPSAFALLCSDRHP